MGSNTVNYADVDRNNPGTGCVERLVPCALTRRILEFPTMAEAEEAISKLAGIDINGTPVTVEISHVCRP
jgi:arginine/serine-rich splicing factor 4/5/6